MIKEINNKKHIIFPLVLYIFASVVGALITIAARGVGGVISNQGTSNIIFLFFRTCIVMGISMEVYKGEKWARIVLIVLAFLSGFSALFGTITIFRYFILGLLYGIIAALNIFVGFYMIFSKKVKVYYNMNTQEDVMEIN